MLSVSCERNTENRTVGMKRKHNFVSLEKKLDAIKRLDQGQTLRKVASELGVGEATVWDWKKKREDIKNWCSQRLVENGSVNSIRKTMRKGEYEKTSEALYQWFLQMKENGNSVTGPILQSKALELHRNFNEGEEFTASSGWLERWKKRYGVSGKKLNVTSERLSADIEETTTFSTEVETGNNRCLDGINSNDETVMNFKLTSVKSLVTNPVTKSEENSTIEYKEVEDKLSSLANPDLSGKWR